MKSSAEYALSFNERGSSVGGASNMPLIFIARRRGLKKLDVDIGGEFLRDGPSRVCGPRLNEKSSECKVEMRLSGIGELMSRSVSLHTAAD